MKAAPPLVFPSSRVLAGWWRQLAHLTPRALAVGRLLLHHVEALVLSERSTPLDPFASFVLRALSQSPSLPLPELEVRLPLGRQLLGRVLAALSAGALAEVDGAGRWRVTGAGREAAEDGQSRRTGYERRAFHFRDTPPAPFVPLEVPPGHEVAPPDHWRFDPAVLRHCVERPPEWKRRHGFPTEVRAVLTPDSSDAPGEPPAWQRVVLDRPEALVLALVVIPGEALEGELRGFAVEPRGWLLSAARPALTMGPGWPEVFPELAPEPSAEAWRGPWRAWCQGHGVAPAEADACALSRDGPFLRAEVPRELLARLHSVNGETAHDEVWLLAGEGAMRTAARVEVTPLATLP
jgi:hypothetical protein